MRRRRTTSGRWSWSAPSGARRCAARYIFRRGAPHRPAQLPDQLPPRRRKRGHRGLCRPVVAIDEAMDQLLVRARRRRRTASVRPRSPMSRSWTRSSASPPARRSARRGLPAVRGREGEDRGAGRPARSRRGSRGADRRGVEGDDDGDEAGLRPRGRLARSRRTRRRDASGAGALPDGRATTRPRSSCRPRPT